MNLKKAILLLAGTALFSGMLAASVWAQTGCVGSQCNGRDPQSSGCGSDAKTIGENSTTYWDGVGRYTLRVQLRYSPRCQAGWIIADRVMKGSQFILRDAKSNNLLQYTANVNGQVRGDMSGERNRGFQACVSLPSGQNRPGMFCTNPVPNPS
jgi:hypothetical protein